MGLQDRDYMKRQGSQKNDNIFKRPKTTNKKTEVNFTSLFSAIISLLVLWYWTDKIYHRMQENHQEIKFQPPVPIFDQRDNINHAEELLPGGVVLTADKQGHFRGTVLINNIPMPFLIDTGATNTSIPVAMANQAKLPIGEIGQTTTANGKAAMLSTQIESLKIGNAEIRNSKANMLYNLDEVLIGMNTLKFFSISIKNNTMTMMNANSEKMSVMTSELKPDEPRPQKAAKKWKKNVTCDSEGMNCKTAYSK